MDADRVPRVFVQHPISDQTEDQMHGKADLCFEQIFDSITKDWKSDIHVVVDDADEKKNEECST